MNEDSPVKIDPSIKLPADLLANEPQVRPGRGSATTAAASAPVNPVRLSAIASQLQANAAGSAADVFDTHKVDEIKAAISEGRFGIDPAKVADGLIETVRSLLDGPKD